ncbi:uncharacterized protein LOC115043364 isoform X2 [Echeneis naucrates]|uniref:uncharacterized protein LOC115043364 isoform X2 n=1 Tax=Echeneis naucrates TaxID=173247 RepID=UPI00111405D2|nr:uncharacterized protein LOC115043364 isoform X2 [Echeneis naucrates]
MLHVWVFLSFLCIFEPWLVELTPTGDVIALRFLLFLSHTYGAVLLLITPLMAVETLTRLLWPHVVITHRAVRETVDSEGERCHIRQAAVDKKEDSSSSDKDKNKALSHAVSYLCCLSVWVVVALNVRWRWKLEDEWAAACLYTTSSLIRCLPKLFSPMPSSVSPSWVMAVFSLPLLLLTASTAFHRQHWTPSCAEERNQAKSGVNSNSYTCWHGLSGAHSAASEPANPGMSELAQCVDHEKTESSCSVHRVYSWNIVQVLADHHGDFVLVSLGCLPAERRVQELQRTKTGIPLTFITEEHVDSQHRSQLGWRRRGFPCLGVNVILGFVALLSIAVLPLNLSVNVLLIRSVERLMQLCVRSFVSSAADMSDTPASLHQTFV